MGSIPQLGEVLRCPELNRYVEPASRFDQKDEIKAILARHLKTQPTADWRSVLEAADICCADVLDWHRLLSHEGFAAVDTLQTVTRESGASCATTRCPIMIDGQRPSSPIGSPSIGQHNETITTKFLR